MLYWHGVYLSLENQPHLLYPFLYPLFSCVCAYVHEIKTSLLLVYIFFASSAVCVQCQINDLNPTNTSVIAGCPSLDVNLGKDFLNRLITQKMQQQTRVNTTTTTYIAFLGDSLLRSPFLTMIDSIKGRRWSPARHEFNLSWYHTDQIFCCKDVTTLENCMYGRRGLEFTTSGISMIRFLNQQENWDLCFSFSWQPKPTDDFFLEVKKLHAQKPCPSLIVMNPGLHVVMERWTPRSYQRNVQSILGYILKVKRKQPSKPISYAFHEITHVQEHLLPKHKKHITNAAARELNDILRLEIDRISPNVHLLPTYNLTRYHPGLKPRDDGIHYDGVYQVIVNFLHINVLLKPYLHWCVPS